ncbi:MULTISPECIES: response regulator [Paenibacillus]|uniref:response regulator n=1 Tax=Paenibacillus TaxID=44249 RepID=UPI0022B8EABE|nr:response regulator [Paenibacillus caseinilyticus]MCZ8521304.1 response regulator [Paenibacillus caseinilyticus]
MFKVLVVDDEPLMLEGWKTMVDWQSCGYELCGTATDGEEALAWIRVHEPDLVFTDVRMPVLDGLGLIRAMRDELRVSPMTVIVSAYSEFTYAQQALRYQVDRYVLKPLVPEEIHKLLLEQTGPLEKRLLERDAAPREQAAAAAAAVVSLLKQGGPAAAGAAARLLGVREGTRCGLLIAEAAQGDPGRGDDGMSLLPRVQTMAGAEFPDRLQLLAFEEAPGRAGLLVLDGGSSGEAFESRLTGTAAMLAEQLEHAAVYCSRAAIGLSGLPELYRQTMATRRQSMLCGRRTGMHRYQEHPAAPSFRLEDLTRCTGTLLHAMDSGDVEGVSRAADTLILLLERSGAQECWVQAAVRHLHGELLRRYAASGEAAAEEDGWLRQMLPGQDGGADAWSGESLKRLWTETSGRLAGKQGSPLANPSVAAEAVAYLKRHYREKIRLQDLARRFHLSPVYFGQQFKRETGMRFNEFLHRLRIDEALKLLRLTELRVSEIAPMLGYHDAEYFTDKFKALTGESPSVYKSKCRGERRAESKPDIP